MTSEPSRQTSQPRARARQLLDSVPEDRVLAAVELLGQLVEPSERPRAGRKFRTVGVFDGAPDLGRRSKQLARRELGGESGSPA